MNMECLKVDNEYLSLIIGKKGNKGLIKSTCHLPINHKSGHHYIIEDKKSLSNWKLKQKLIRKSRQQSNTEVMRK